MEINEERFKDAVDIGNFNSVIPFLHLTIKQHSLLTFEEKKKFSKEINEIHKKLLNITVDRTFKEK